LADFALIGGNPLDGLRVLEVLTDTSEGAACDYAEATRDDPEWWVVPVEKITPGETVALVLHVRDIEIEQLLGDS
jgi:hypothetical protein